MWYVRKNTAAARTAFSGLHSNITLKIFVYILIISFLLNVVIGFIGEDTLAGFFTAMPLVGEAVAALVGLIPNCASSVVITELYLGGIIGAGA